MALLLSATRWVEQAHAALKAILEVVQNLSPAGASASLRFPEHVDNCLHLPEARAYVAANWNTRNVFLHNFPYAGIIPGMAADEQLRRVYRFRVESQFREKAVCAAYTSAAKAVGAAAHLHAIGDEVKLMLDYIRSSLPEGKVFSLVDDVADCCVTEVGKAVALDDGVDPGIVTGVLTRMKALVDAGDTDTVPSRLCRFSRFFVVVKSEPHRRFEMPVGGHRETHVLDSRR